MSNIKLIENYNKAIQEIYNHVNYDGDIYLIDDCTNFYWRLLYEKIIYHEDKNIVGLNFKSITYNENDINFEEKYYSSSCYSAYLCNGDKNVYKGKIIILVFCINDSVNVGEIYAIAFDSNKEIIIGE